MVFSPSLSQETSQGLKITVITQTYEIKKEKYFRLDIGENRSMVYSLYPEQQAAVAITAIINIKAMVLFHSKVLFLNCFLFYFHKNSKPLLRSLQMRKQIPPVLWILQP